MKKIILLVAAILTAIQTIANRSVERTNSNPLVLSPSDGIYNHGSHASHASHCSHYSMSITVKKDSAQNVSQGDRKYIIHSLAIMHNCADKDIDILGLYISKNNGITTQERGESSKVRYKPAPNEKCLYVSFNKWNRGQYSSFRFQEYIIPLSSVVSDYYCIGDGHHYNAVKKEKWMIDFANKNK